MVFLRYFSPFFLRVKLKCPHIMNPVSKLDQYDPDIVRHGKNHFSDTFGLTCLRIAAKGKGTQFGYPRDNMCNFVSEHSHLFLPGWHGYLRSHRAIGRLQR